MKLFYVTDIELYLTDTVGSYGSYQEFLEERHANDWIDN